MSTFQLARMRTLRLTAMKLVLIVAAADLVAGITVILDQPRSMGSDVKAGEAVLAVAGAAASPPDKSRSKAWYAVDEAISSSFAKRSRLFDISGLVIVR